MQLLQEDLKECTCKPIIYKICHECDGENKGCWACENGMVMVAEDIPDENLVYVHEEHCKMGESEWQQ